MCHEFVEELYVYLDGELSDADCRALQAHLESCAPCMAEYQRDARLKELVRRSCACEPAPTELRERIVTYIHSSVTVVRRQA
ncbi:mycothiol system anti-sigma-R factor [Kytococcus sp. Marseille-QA3725]